MATKYENADRAIAAYDAFVFAAVGRTVENFADRADCLALIAALECDVAARDRTVNQFTRDFYREQARFMRQIGA
jgi:hypothetical protein